MGIRRLIKNNDKEPFGFIAPEQGGRDVWFGKHLISGEQSWEQFEEIVMQYSSGNAMVSYVVETVNGKTRAKGVLALPKEQADELDSDDDGQVSAAELQSFLEANSELRDANKTSQDIAYELRQKQKEQRAKEREEEVAAYERTSQQRGELYRKLQAKEDAMHDQIDVIYNDRRVLKTKADKLWAESNAAWESGDKDGAKLMQAEVKELHKQRQELMQKARSLQHELESLDWANNEQMFEFVQSQEHAEEQDGTWIDLHGLEAGFAVYTTEHFLVEAAEKGITQVEIITGRGNHSGKKGPILKGKIWTNSDSLLNRAVAGEIAGLEGVQYHDSDGNDGDVTVVLPSSNKRSRSDGDVSVASPPSNKQSPDDGSGISVDLPTPNGRYWCSVA